MGYHNLGVAQGGMVDNARGDWYLFKLFQDKGSVRKGAFGNDGFNFRRRGISGLIGSRGRVPAQVRNRYPARPDYAYRSLNGMTNFLYRTDENGKSNG